MIDPLYYVLFYQTTFMPAHFQLYSLRGNLSLLPTNFKCD